MRQPARLVLAESDLKRARLDGQREPKNRLVLLIREHVEVFEPRASKDRRKLIGRIRAIVRLIEIQSAGRRRFSLCDIGCSP